MVSQRHSQRLMVILSGSPPSRLNQLVRPSPIDATQGLYPRPIESALATLCPLLKQLILSRCRPYYSSLRARSARRVCPAAPPPFTVFLQTWFPVQLGETWFPAAARRIATPAHMPQQHSGRSSGLRQSSSAQPSRPLSAGNDGSTVASLYCDACDRHGHVGANCPHFAGRSRGSVPWLSEEHSDALQPSETEIAANISSGNVPDVLVEGA